VLGIKRRPERLTKYKFRFLPSPNTHWTHGYVAPPPRTMVDVHAAGSSVWPVVWRADRGWFFPDEDAAGRLFRQYTERDHSGLR
jgi:hypothetical protein